MEKKSYTRKSEIVLADGNTYTFYAIPFGPRLIRILKAFKGEATNDEILVWMFEETEKSLLLSYSKEQVAEIFDMGLIPSPDALQGDDETSAIARRILSALIVQMIFDNV